MADEAAGGGDDHVGAKLQGALLLLVADAVVAAIDADAGDVVEVVGETLHGLVYLLGQLAGGGHDDTVDGIAREAAVAQLREHGQQVGGCLAGARLGYADEVAPFEQRRDGLFLNGRTLCEVHVVEGVKDIVVEVEFFELHNCWLIGPIGLIGLMGLIGYYLRERR